MSSTTTTSAAAPSVSICNNLYDVPTRDAYCAMPYTKNYLDMMKTCCGDADVYSYYDECGLFCVSEDQSVEDLTQCLYGEGAAYEHVFCDPDDKATATGDGKPIATVQSSLVSGDGDDNDDDEGDSDDSDDNNNDNEGDDSEGNSDNSNDDDDSAAPHSSVSLFGVVVGTLLFSTTALNAVFA